MDFQAQPQTQVELPDGFGLADPVSLMEQRGVGAASGGWTRAGSEFDTTLPHNLLEADSANGVYSPAYVPGSGANLDDLAFGLYLFDPGDFTLDTTIHLDWAAQPADYGNAWLGVANFQRNRWEWFMPGGANQVFLKSFAPYRRFWEDGEMLAVVALTGTTQAGLSRIYLGMDVPGDSIYAVPSKTEVDAGETVRVTIYVNQTAEPLLVAQARLLLSEGNELVEDSFNLGTPGGAQTFRDGIWARTDSDEMLFHCVQGDFYDKPEGFAAVDVGVGILGSVIPDATGALFNFELRVNQSTQLQFQRQSDGNGNGLTSYRNLGSNDDLFWANDTNEGQPGITVRGNPTAVLDVAPVAGDAPLQVSFDASASTDIAPGHIARYEFDFGEGAEYEDNGLSPVAQHTYNQHGTYPVRLRVTDDSGLVDIAYAQVMSIRYDEAEDNDSAETAGSLPGVQFSGFRGNVGEGHTGIVPYDGDTIDYFSVDLEADVYYRFVIEGDGADSIDIGLLLVDNSGGQVRWGTTNWKLDDIQYLEYYPDADELPMTLAVWGGYHSYDYLLTSMRRPPHALLSSDVFTGGLPLTVILDASDSSDYEGKDIVRYEFSLEEGAAFIDNGTNPYLEHMYTEEDLYLPKVRVFDDEGNYDIQTLPVYAGREYDEIEKNSAYVDAQLLTLPVVNFSGSCGKLYDTDTDTWIYKGYDGGSDDYFRFNVYSGETINVTLDLDSTTGDLDIYLLDPGRNVLAASETEQDHEEIRYTVQPGEQVRYLKVTNHGQGGDYSDYMLNVFKENL